MLISRRQLAAMAASLRMQLTSLVSSPLMLDRLPHSHLAYRIRVTVRVRGAAMAIANSPRIEAVGEERLPRPPKPYIPIPTNLDTIVVEPKGKHKATIVWLHGLGQSGSKCAADIESYRELQHPHIKWILPTAPLRNVDLREGLVTAWYNATPIFKEGHFIDLEGLDKTAERVVNILLKEQPEDGEKKVKVVVGGFSQGCATALYITKCSFLGKYSNGNPFPLNLDAAMAFGGWMPTIKTLEEEVNAVPDARQRAGEIPMFFGHCEGAILHGSEIMPQGTSLSDFRLWNLSLCKMLKIDDKIMPSRQMGLAISAFQNVGANNITSKTYSKGGHSFTAEEAADVLKWLVATLDLETLEEADETPDFMEVKDPVNEEETGGPDENVTISECSEQQSMMPIDGQHTDCSITVV